METEYDKREKIRQASRAEKRKKVLSVLRKVTNLLNEMEFGPWKFEPRSAEFTEPGAIIEGPNGKILMAANWKEGKVEIIGIYPSESYNRSPHPNRHAINVSVGRKPEAIAKDIHRRLVVDYVPEYHRIVEAQRKHDDNEQQCTDRMQRIGALVDQRITQYEIKDHRFSRYNDHDIGAIFSNHEDRVDLEIANLTEAQATAVIECVLKMKGKTKR